MGRALCVGLIGNGVGCVLDRAEVRRLGEYGNPERVAATSPRLLYSATLGNASESRSNPERVAADRASWSIIRDTTPLGLESLTPDAPR
jgi:hypothetical protein